MTNGLKTGMRGRILLAVTLILGIAALLSISIFAADEPSALELRYDDRYDVTGKTVEILDAGTPTSYLVGYGVAEGTPDAAVVTLDGDTLIATGIGTASVRIDGEVYEVTVKKAKVNIVVIMGQSNAGNHFANATSDVTCPAGTAYWWGNGKGTAATAPVDYTQPSMGFHTPLLAELYAQSVSAGDPVKNVMVWQEGITSKNGKSITKWAASETDTSGTNGTATMLRNCISYYEQNSDLYEIENCGVYWLQGESDVAMVPETYTKLFLAMWGDLKDAGAEYMAFFRVRKGVTLNGEDHEDLSYTGSLAAQIHMVNTNPDMYMATTVTENWTGTATTEHSVDISRYVTLMEQYGKAESHTDSYGNAATVKNGILTTTMKTLYGSNNKCHYGKFGYAIIGADAAYHMYHALHGEQAAIVQGDTSGKAAAETVRPLGKTAVINIESMTENLTFRPACGSAAGTLELQVKSGDLDVTDQVIATDVNAFGTVDTSLLRELDNVTITATYTPVHGTPGSVTYTVVDHTHTYVGGVCTACGNAQALELRYDDRYDVTGKTVEILDAGAPTSYLVGYGVAEGTPDAAVVTLEGDTLIATGIGTASVRIDGEVYEVTVSPAPISLILLIGQSNMRGSEGNAAQSIVCPDGMVYATYGDDRGADNTAMTTANASMFAPSALTGEYSRINVNGTTDCLEGYPVYSLTEAGAGKIGPDSGFAYEWVKQTGEKVWIVNAAHGGTSISVWQPGTTEYEQCQALFAACQQTLQAEIAAGHYTLSQMGYFWCQGCSDRTKTAEWYVKKYLAMHEGLKTELAFDHDGDAATPERTFAFGGIIPVRIGSSASGYRDGVYEISNPYAYHESFVDLRMSGPRVAQYWLGNNPELTDIWTVCTIGEDWAWMPDGTNGVSAYFNAHYENGTVNYTTQVAQKQSWYTPTTPAAVHDSIHYNQIGYNEIGRESVRNILYILGVKQAPEVETAVKLVGWDGYTEVESTTAATSGASSTLVVPMVTPLWKAKEVTYSVTEGLTYSYYDLLADSAEREGALSVVGAQGGVTVEKGEPGAHFADHLSTMPESVCKETNLWPLLEHDAYYYASGTNWGLYSGGNVCSVTIPVREGERIFASSFGKAGTNGHASSNGIRTTFFSAYGIAKTLSPAETYAEFTKNGGYLIAPEGTVAINIAMWSGSDEWEIYLLDREHTFTPWAEVTAPSCDTEGQDLRSCTVCGEVQTRDTRVSGDASKIQVSDPRPEDFYAGKTVVCIGDSITAGVGTTAGTEDYVTLLANLLGANTVNRGASGTVLCTGGPRTCNIEKLNNLPSGTALVTIMMGINDWYVAQGDAYRLGEQGSEDTTTVYGAVRAWCEKIEALRKEQAYAQTEFVFVTPLIASWDPVTGGRNDWSQDKANRQGYTLRQLCTAILEVCAEYGIPVFDANQYSGIYYRGAEDNNVGETGGDGVHVNAKGHALLAEALAEYLLEGYSYADRTVADCGHRFSNCVCTVCGAKAEHTYTSTVTPPTCTEGGFTTHTCACGKSYVDSYVDVTWHSYDNGQCADCGIDMMRLSLADLIQYQGSVQSTNGAVTQSHTNNKYVEIRIPQGATQVRYYTFATNSTYGSAFFGGGAYVFGTSDTSPAHWVTVDIPGAADTLRYGFLKADPPAYLEFAGEELTVLDPPALAERPATGCHAFSVQVNIAPAKGNPNGYEVGTDYGYILLPTNYSASGDPVRLIIVCHGAGASLDTYRSDAWKNTNYSFWTELGYAVMDMYACPPELSGDNSALHYGNPVVLDCYLAGYEYVMERFNLKQDGIFLIGSSMGGLSSFQIAQSEKLPVIAQVGYCPVIDLFKQAYCNPWTSSVYQRERIASYFGFTGAAPTFTSGKLPSAAEIEYFKQNLDKILPYSPILHNVISGDPLNLFGVIPSSPTVTSAEEQALYAQLTATHPNPLMIFHNLDDSTVSYRYSQYFVEMLRRSGQEATLYTFATGGHNAWANGGSFQVTGINGSITLKESQYRSYLFFDAFERHEEHCAWVDPAEAPTCTQSGKTQGSHCAVCGEILTAQTTVDVLGHNYSSVITKPTCTEGGFTTHTCACGDTYVDSYVDATGHSEAVDAALLPTSSRSGRTEGKHCSACGEILVEQESIPAKGFEWMLEDGEFKILLIGNSYSEDASCCAQGMPDSQLFDILQAMLGEDVKVTVGAVISGGKGINWHATQAETNAKSYYFKVMDSDTKTWRSLGSFSSSSALSWTDWDVVSLQVYNVNPSTGKEGVPYPGGTAEKFYPLEVASEFMLDHIHTHAPAADTYFYMHWAQTSSIAINAALSAYQKLAAYIPAVLDFAGEASGNRFETVIPVGLSVQNARTTYLALLAYNTTAYADKNLNLNTDAQIGLQRDGGHLSFNIGRYIAGLTFAETIIPQSLRAEGYILPDIRVTESIGKLPKEYTTIAQKSVFAAVESWKNGSLEVTEIAGYAEDPTLAAVKRLEESLLSLLCGCDGEGMRPHLLALLPEDFAVESVTFTEGDTKSPGAEFTCLVSIRFGYTSRTATVKGRVTAHAHASTVTPPTCTEKGFTTHTCACGDTYTDSEVAALGHSYSSVVTKPTCTEGGFTTHTCSVCEHSYVDNETNALGHSYSSVVTKPTCTEGGFTTHTCATCGDTYTDSKVDALGHDYDSVITKPTCTEKGFTTHTCSVCGHSYTDGETDALGHNYTSVVTKPTCTEGGFTTHTCSVCEHSYVDSEINALGHSYSFVVTKPTCTDGGYTSHTCTACGDTYVDGVTDALGHDYSSVVTKPTCTDGGYTTHTCATCGHSYTDSKTDALGHDYDSAITKPTCTDGGYTTHTCATCGDTYTDSEVDALGHSYSSVVTKPTCTEGGFTTHTCATCGDTYVDNETDALGHDYSSVVTKPTCTEGGFTTHTCATCGHSYTDSKTDALGHSYSSVVTKPTCTEGGFTTHICATCGDTYTDSKTEALGHDYSSVVTKPTCTEGGFTTHTCATCGDAYTDSETEATGHRWDDGELILPPTETAEGERRFTCLDCGETRSETVDKLPPAETDPETDPETAPETEPETDPETAPETDPEANPEIEPETEPAPSRSNEDGVILAVSLGAAVLLLSGGAALILPRVLPKKRSRETEDASSASEQDKSE